MGVMDAPWVDNSPTALRDRRIQAREDMKRWRQAANRRRKIGKTAGQKARLEAQKES
jgi:hypothetical protein